MGPLKHHAKVTPTSIVLQGPKDTPRPCTVNRLLKKSQPIRYRPLKRLNQHMGWQDKQDPAQTDRPPRIRLPSRIRPVRQTILRRQRRNPTHLELLEILIEKEIALQETLALLMLNGRPENQRPQQDHRNVINEQLVCGVWFHGDKDDHVDQGWREDKCDSVWWKG